MFRCIIVTLDKIILGYIFEDMLLNEEQKLFEDDYLMFRIIEDIDLMTW